MESLVPPAGGNPPGDNPPEPTPRNERRCEGCGCRIDVKGRIIERGDKLKTWLDSEETTRAAEKAAREANGKIASLETELQQVRAKLQRYETRGFGETL